MGYYNLPWGLDMVSGSLDGSLNIAANQGLLDYQARQTLFQVPTMNLMNGCIYSEMTPQAPSIPGFMNNYAWQQQSNAFWSNFGAGNNGYGINGMNGVSNPFFPNAGNSNGSSSGSNSNLSDEEKVYKKQYDRLKGFLTQLNQYAQKESSNILTQSQRDKLDAVLKSTGKKTYQEKLEELQSIYNELDKSDIKKFIVKAYKTDDKKLFYDQLIEAGYEDPNGKIEQGSNKSGNAITALHTALKNIGKEDANTSVPMGCVDGYDVLDVISSWNSAYPGESFMSLYKKSYSKVDSEEKDTVKSGYQPLIDNLISTAKQIAEKLDENSNKKLKDAANKLSEAFEKNQFGNIEKYFNEVYVMTRIATAKSLGNQLADKYGETDQALFNDNMFMEETIEDLKNEKLESLCKKYSNSIKMHKSRSHEGSSATGGSGSSDSNVTSSDISGSIKDLQKEIDDIKKEMDDADSTNSPATMGRKLYKLTDGDTDSHQYNRVNKILEQVDKDNVVQFLNSYNSKKKYNPNSITHTEGIIEMLDDEWDGGAIKMDNKKHLIEAFLEKAKELKLEGTDEYKEIEDILENYQEDGKYANKKTFNHGVKGFFGKKSTYSGAAAGAAIGSIFGIVGAAVGAVAGGLIGGLFKRRTDNENIDMYMKILLGKMNEKMKAEAKDNGINENDAITKSPEYLEQLGEKAKKEKDLKILKEAKEQIDKLKTETEIEDYRTAKEEIISNYPQIGEYLEYRKEKLSKKQEAETKTETTTGNDKNTTTEAETKEKEEKTTK